MQRLGLENGDHVAFVDRVALCEADLGDFARRGGDHRDFHLHGFENDDGIVFGNAASDWRGYLPDLACDFRIVAERTKLSLPETRLGIVPDVGGTVRLVKLIGPSRAKEVILTGGNIEPEKAEQWGMVNYVVPKEELMNKANELAEELKLSAPLAVNYAKRVINDIMDVQRGLNVEAWAQSALFRSEDFTNGVQAMLTKTYPVEWKGK